MKVSKLSPIHTELLLQMSQEKGEVQKLKSEHEEREGKRGCKLRWSQKTTASLIKVREFSSIWPKFTEGIVKMFANLKQSRLKTFISGWHFVVEEIIYNMEVYGQEPELWRTLWFRSHLGHSHNILCFLSYKRESVLLSTSSSS